MKKAKAYMVATAHLDTVWNWTLEDTVKRFLKETLERNFALLDKYPQYRFNFEGAYRYDLIKEYYPEDYEKLKRYIAEGRWCVAGSSWENGDVITPAPETLMRNILYGNRFFEQEFGKRSNDIFLPDCFGFPCTLPTVMRHMGLTAFSSQKLTWNEGRQPPFHVGIWEGIDGSEVIAALDPGAYTTQLVTRPDRDTALYERTAALPAAKDLRYYGTGDTGGAPTEESVRLVNEAAGADESPFEIVSAYSGQLADELTKAERAMLPRTNEELLMVTHGVGSYTSVAPAKRFHRANECKADFAERSAVLAAWLGARDYPGKTFEKAWKDFIRHEFHDDLTGTSVQRAYRETFHDDIVVANTLDGEIGASLKAVAANTDTGNGEGIKLVVFNPTAFDRCDMAEATLTFDDEAPAYVSVSDPDGNVQPSQITSRHDGAVTVLFRAAVPSQGHAVYCVTPAAAPYRNAALRIAERSMENERLSVALDENGDISSVFDKENGVQLLSAPIRYEILRNSFRHYGAWEIGYDDLTAPPCALVSGPIRTRILQNGGCRVSLEVVRTLGASRFTQVLSLDAGSGFLRVYNDVNWTQSRAMLKLAFPLRLTAETAVYDAGLGSVERGDRAPGKFEVPVHTWANVYDKTQDYSVTILNDCKYAMDKYENVLRLTCIHTPANKFMDETRQDVQDHGQNVYSFAIGGGRGDFRTVRAHQAGTAFNHPLAVCRTASHDGLLPPTFSFLSVSPAQVSVLAVKKAEDSDEIVVRVCESDGRETRAALTFGCGITCAREINGFEAPVGDAVTENDSVVFTLKPFEPKTFAVRLQKPAGAPIKSKYIPLTLDGHTPFTSGNADRGRWGIGAEKVTVPREIIEKDFKTADVPFSFCEKEEALCCLVPEGETLLLPEGTDVLYMVAARSDADGMYTLLADATPISFGVQSFADDIGGWDQIGSGHYGFIREDRVAFCASHTHDISGDRVYGRFNWYLYSISLPAGTGVVTLPADSGMMIAAVTAGTDSERAKLVSDIALHKTQKKPHRLDADGHIGGGVYRAGDPVYLVYTGETAGEITWTASDGSVYRGMSVVFDMPDHDLTVHACIEPYAKKLPLPCLVIADTAAEGHKASDLTDGKISTMWLAATDGPAQVLLDLGAKRRFGHTVLYHAGVCETDQTRNTYAYTVEYLCDGVWTFLTAASGNILPVTQHNHAQISAQFLRIRIETPTRNGNDGRAALAAVDCYADADYGEETEPDAITAYDLIDGLRTAQVLYDGVCAQDAAVRFPRTVIVRGWRVTGAACAAVTLENEAGEAILTEEGRDVVRRGEVARLVPETAANGIRVFTRTPVGEEQRLTVFGISFALSPLKKYSAADCGGTRNPAAVKHEDGRITLPACEGQGHDLYGFMAQVPGGHITFSMKLRIASTVIASLPDHTPLFQFCPVFLTGEQYGRVVTAGDYLAAPADGDGFRVLSETFVNTAAGGCEGRITSFRNAQMEVMSFTFYQGKP